MQIRANLEMESHEEKLHIMVQQSKMESAKESAQNAAKAIRERQREQQRFGLNQSAYSGIGSSSNTVDSPSASCRSMLLLYYTWAYLI